MITRHVFYDEIRKTLLHVLTQQQVTGIEAIFDYWESIPKSTPKTMPWVTPFFMHGETSMPIAWLAYILATAYHETAHTFRDDIREAEWLSEEWRKTHLRYYPYYGRGPSQLTWKHNYYVWQRLLGIQFVGSPDNALGKIGIEILIRGMIEGRFSGHRLSDYTSEYYDVDFVNARHIVNGTDSAVLIANYAMFFKSALIAAEQDDTDNPNADAKGPQR